jgi:hypothetical protein
MTITIKVRGLTTEQEDQLFNIVQAVVRVIAGTFGTAWKDYNDE